MRSLPLAPVVVVFATAPALADVELTTEAGSSDVRELEHRRQLTVRPLWLEVSDTHRFRNQGQRTLQLIYRFDLPEDAAITGVEVSDGKRSHRAVGIDSAAAIRPLPDNTADAQRSDLALLRQIEAGRYELTIYPMDPGVAVTATIRAIVPTSLTDGRMAAKLPARGALYSANLAATKISARPSGWRSIKRLDELTLNGKRATRLDIAAGDEAGLAVQARAIFGRGAGLDLGMSAVALDGELGALAIAGAAAPGSRVLGRYLHAVLLIDVSASMGRSGLRAAAEVADAILANLPPTTRVAIVPFDRTARTVGRGFAANDHQIRGALARALAIDTLANGSDVLAALARADRLIGGREATRLAADARISGEPTAAAISDAAAPLRINARSAFDRVSSYTRGEAVFFAVTVAADGRSFPRPSAGPLDELISRSGGAAFAVRAATASQQAPDIARQLGIANQLVGLRARLGDQALDEIDMPDRLAPGSGFLTLAPWAGAPPRAIAVTAAQRGSEVRESVRRSRDPALESAAAALVLHRLDPLRVAEAHQRAELRGGHEAPLSPERDAARQIARAGVRHGVVTPYVSLVIPDPSDRFAAEQLAFVKKWGSWLYRRAPTPSELAGDVEHRLWRGATQVASTGAGRTGPSLRGSIEPAVMRREIRAQLFRRMRSCYDRELRAAPRLRGSLTLQLDISDGEVRDVAISRGSIGRAGLRRCVINAGFRFKPPRAAGDHETVYLVRYPFRFRVVGERGDVSEDDGSGKQIELDPDDPLDGID
jgi:hypothetical protein